MNILFCQPTLARSGSEKSLFEVIAGLREKTQHHLHLLAGENGPMFGEFSLVTDSLRIVEAPKLRRRLRALPSHIRSWWTVFRAIRRMRHEHAIDLVYVNTVMFPQALFAAALNGLTCVTHIHEVGTSYPGLYYRFCMGAATLLSARVVCPCRHVQEQRGLPFRHRLLNRARVIPNSSHFDVAPLRRTIADDAIVLCVIPITRRKGIDDVLSLAAEIKRLSIAARIEVIGRTGSPEVLDAVLERHRRDGLSDILSFHPETDDIRPHYRRAHIIVHPSHSECHPRVLVEAANFSLPSVCTNAGGSAEVVSDGKTGFVVSVSDFKAMAKCIQRLIDEPELYASLSVNAYKRYDSEFTRGMLTARITEVIEALGVGR